MVSTKLAATLLLMFFVGFVVILGSVVDLFAANDQQIFITYPTHAESYYLQNNGTLMLQNDGAISCNSTSNGSIYYDTSDFWGCNGTGWNSFTTAGAETDPIYTAVSSNLAHTGNCAAGGYVQNTTTSGVQCGTPTATGDGNNYTSGIDFAGTTTKTLNLARSGAANLTASFTDLTNSTADVLNAANNSGINILLNAGTASKFAADPPDCSAGQAPRGINASGDAQGCTTYLQSETYQGTVTSVSCGDGLTGGTFTTSGTCAVNASVVWTTTGGIPDTNISSAAAWNAKGTSNLTMAQVVVGVGNYSSENATILHNDSKGWNVNITGVAGNATMLAGQLSTYYLNTSGGYALITYVNSAGNYSAENSTIPHNNSKGWMINITGVAANSLQLAGLASDAYWNRSQTLSGVGATTACSAGQHLANFTLLNGSAPTYTCTADAGNITGTNGVSGYLASWTSGTNVDKGALWQNTTHVGIRTAVPNYTLDVNGDLRVDGATFFANSTSNMVGVGTTAPNYTLHVVGNANISTVLYTPNITMGGVNNSIVWNGTCFVYYLNGVAGGAVC